MPSPTKSHVGTSKKPRTGELERSKEKLMAITQKHNEVVINNVAHRQRIKELENEVYDLKDEVIALSKQNVALIAEVARLRRRPTARTLGNPDETKMLLGVVNSLLLSVPALSLLRDQLVATPATPPRATSIPPSLWTPKFNPHGPFKTSQSPQGLNGLTEEDEEDFDSDDEDENGPTSNYLPTSLSIPEPLTSVPNPPKADHLTDLTSRSQARASRASRRSSGLVAVPQLLVPPPPSSSLTASRPRKSKSPTPDLEEDGYRDHETMGTIPDEVIRDDNLSTNPASISEPLEPRVLYELMPLRDGGLGKGKGREILGSVSDTESPLEPLAIKVESVAQTPITNLHNQPSPLLVGPVEPAASSRKVGPSVAVSASQPPRPTPSRSSTTSQRSTLSSVQSQARVPPTRPTSAASSNASASSSSSESSTARSRATAAAALRTKSSSTTTNTISQSSSTSRIQSASTPSSTKPSSNLKSSASSSTSTTIAATSSASGSKAPIVRTRDVADVLRRGVTTAPPQPSPASSFSAVSAPLPPQAKDKPPMAPTTLVQPEEEEQQSSQTDEPSFGPATEVFESPGSQGTDEGAAADGGVDGAAARRARRVSKAINYKEPSLTKKMRDESRVAERKSTSSRPSTTSRPTNSARTSTTPRPHSPRPTTAAPTSGGAASSFRSVSPALLREDEDELTATATGNVTSVASAGTRRKSVLPPRKTAMAAAGSAGKKRAAVAAMEEGESDMATSENESLSSTSEAGNGEEEEEEEEEASHPFDVALSLSAKSRRTSTTTTGITIAARTQTAREALDRHWAESAGETTPKASHQQQAKMAAPTATRRTSSFAQGLPLAEKNGLAENSRDHREEAEGMVKKVVGKRRASSRVSGIGA